MFIERCILATLSCQWWRLLIGDGRDKAVVSLVSLLFARPSDGYSVLENMFKTEE